MKGPDKVSGPFLCALNRHLEFETSCYTELHKGAQRLTEKAEEQNMYKVK